jgi:hypothetical protein
MRPEVGGSEAKNARAPWPRRDAKRLDFGRARLENVGASFAKRSKLTRSLMSACSFGKMSATLGALTEVVGFLLSFKVGNTRRKRVGARVILACVSYKYVAVDFLTGHRVRF